MTTQMKPKNNNSSSLNVENLTHLENPIPSKNSPISQKGGMQRWLMDKASSPWGPYILALVSFCESSFFPLPPDLMLIPMLIADRTKAFRLAFLCTITSVLGGIGGYLLGYFLIDTLGQLIIGSYGLETEFQNFQTAFQTYGFWFILIKGVTPIPFKLVTIASGATQMNFWLFLIASTLVRAFRFLMLASIFWYYGEEAKSFYEKNFNVFIIGMVFVVLVGFGVLRLFK